MDVELYFVINLFVLMCVGLPMECCTTDMEKLSQELDELLVGVEIPKRYSRNSENNLEIWQEYEFGTGVGNREELIIESVTTSIVPELSESTDNYQLIESEGQFLLAGFSDNVFSFHNLDLTLSRTTNRIEIKTDRKILTFKLLSLPNSFEPDVNVATVVLAILCVETTNGTELQWYRHTANELVLIWSRTVQNGVERLEFFRHDNENRLLLLGQPEMHLDGLYSSIDIYGFDIFDTDEHLNLWLYQSKTVPKIVDFGICPTYESTLIALRLDNDVIFYEYKKEENEEHLFEKYEEITSNGVNNLICFESGYVSYFATSGRMASIYDYFEGEFHVSKHIFDDVGEVLWITSIPLDTYREESLILAQLKNSTIIGLSWNGQGFDRIQQPHLKFDSFELSKATIIPKYGLLSGKTLIKIVATLRDEPRPLRDDMERLSQTKKILSEILRKQELIIDETEARVSQSYFLNPEVTGFWNITDVEADSVIIDDKVFVDGITLGTERMTPNAFVHDFEEAKNIVNEWESKLVEIETNLANGILINSTDAILSGDLVIDGALDVQGILSVDHLKFDRLNGLSLQEIIQDFYNHDDTLIIEGEKTFESIDADNLTISFINDVPIADITFGNERYDYSEIDFSRLTKLKVDGNLRFEVVNDVEWNELLKRVVMKSQPATILGHTIVEGDLIADNVEIDSLNELQYPQDYVLASSARGVNLSGQKKFHKLTVNTLDLDRLKTINNIPIDEYVTLFGDRTLSEEITFEDLMVTDVLQIDGEIQGLSEDQKGAGLTLNETSVVSSDVVFAKLTILGDLEIENSLNGLKWSELDDLVGWTDRNVEITGHKTFLETVEVASKLTIELQKINDRSIDEFVTLDTEQIFPNLEIISGNVTFKNIVRGDLEDLKNLLNENLVEGRQPKCLEKSISFAVPPTVDHLHLSVVNGHSAQKFMTSINATFSEIHFQHIEVLENFQSRDILSANVNGVNFADLKERRISKTLPQTLSGNYKVDSLKTSSLMVTTINGLSLNHLVKLKNHLDDIYDSITRGSLSIDNLRVNGTVDTTSVNGEAFRDIYTVDAMGTVIFSTDVHVENFTIHGLVNGINFTEFMNGVVMKNDENIVITGDKTFDRVNCDVLDASNLNGRGVDRILDSRRHQMISGAMRVNGTVRIVESFESSGKIGGVSWQEIQDRFQYLGNNTYSMSGDLRFTSDDVSVDNLIVDDSIQGIFFNDFLDSIVYKNSTNVTIFGPVVFKDSVTIDSPLTITERFNDLDLKYFYDNAVRIDRPFDVKSKIRFADDIVVEENLIVDEKLEARTVGGVDLSELYENAAYADRPTFLSGKVTLENVVFESDIEVEMINDLVMSEVLTLNQEQTLPVTLHCMDIAVGNIEISGSVNDQDLDAIWDDTFKLTGNQNISGHIAIVGDVLMRHDFDANLINGMDPREFISLEGNETLIGNFIFEKPLIVGGNIITRGLVNDVDVALWQATAVTTNFPFPQIVNGAWTIRGNVHFENNVIGNAYLDGVNVTSLANDLHLRRGKMEQLAKDVEKNWTSLCEDLVAVKTSAKNQIYRYKYLDHFQTLNFNNSIASVHHFELNDFDYLLVNFVDCHMDIFVFTGMEFALVTSVHDVGHIDRWFDLRFEGEIYFLTIGKSSCNRSTGNLWKLDEEQFTHVDDFGNITDARKISDVAFLLLIDGTLVHRTILEIYQRSLSKPRSHSIGSASDRFVSDSVKLLFANRDNVYEYHSNNTVQVSTNYYGTDAIASFRLGVYRREIFVYYDEHLSEDYLFISDNNETRPEILQTIKAQRPSSALVLNFDGYVENFLIFIENRQRLQIYEYRGIEGFVYRETIDIEAERIYKFELRKYSKLAKINYIATVQENKLVALEAKMYGTKLRMGSLPCEH